MSRDYLAEIEQVLVPLDANLQRGTSDMVDDDVWNYMIYGRDSRHRTGIDKVEKYFVTIVREIEVPEETIQMVIDAVKSLPGFRQSEDDISFEYLRVGTTKQCAEACKIFFVKPSKGV